jgi:type II restriction enzyme
MKFLDFYRTKLGCSNEDEIFEYLIKNLKETIRTWSYFVNWEKVYTNVSIIEKDLNILNYLIGKDSNLEEEFIGLFIEHPRLACLLPILIASRDNEICVLVDFKKNGFENIVYKFIAEKKPTREKAQELFKIFDESGIVNLIKNRKIKNFVDYVTGVEVGLDSNGRKNRGGTAMQDIVEFLIENICLEFGFSYISQATTRKISDKWGIKLPQDKTNRQFDFAIYDKKHLILVETNFYNRPGGSKLKATAGEYKDLHNVIKNEGHYFIWITDGLGWLSTQRPLREAFNYIDYIFNLDMLEKGILEATIKQIA